MNTFDFRAHDGIRLEFLESSPFVIPIPLEEAISTTSDAITIRVKNTSTQSVPFCRNGTLFPELFGESGEAIDRVAPKFLLYRKGRSENYDCVFLYPSQGLWLKICFKVVHVSRKAQLLVAARCGDLSTDRLLEIDYAWSFQDLLPGTYRLRFREHPPSVEILASPNSSVFQKTQRVEIRRTQAVITPSLTLHLIREISAQDRGIEIGGIWFESLVFPQLSANLFPSVGESACDCFGMRVTNLSNIPYRFIFYGMLPQVFDSQGRAIKLIAQNNRSPYLEISDFIEIPTGESAEYWLKAVISSDLEGGVQFSGHDGKGCIFWLLNLPKSFNFYYFRFTYQRNQYQTLEYFLNRHQDQRIQNEYLELVETLWQGTVIMPLIKWFFGR